jgi:hypothetical protein
MHTHRTTIIHLIREPRMMTRQQFWDHIKTIDIAALHDQDDQAAIAPLEESLSTLTVEDLQAFEEHLSQCLFALDGKIYADESGDSGNSDDGFLYVRCYVVAQGQKHFEATLKKPSLMPKNDEWCEQLLYPHRKAWARLTGADETAWEFEASVSYESGSNPDLWP